MDDIERLARVMAANTGHNPNMLVTRYTPYQVFDGSHAVRPEDLVPFWRKFYGHAAAAIAELQMRPLGWKPPEEPAPAEAEGFVDGGTSDPVGLDAGALTSSDWSLEALEAKIREEKEPELPWAERMGLR